jgi:hypothetical protein
MRRLVKKITLLAAALLIMAVPVLANDLSVLPTREPELQQSGKDECLLVAMNCGDRAMSIQNRIDTIKNEIKKGTGVYTTDELRILEKRLEDTKREFNESYEGGA